MDPAAATDLAMYRGLAGFVDNELKGMVGTIAEQFAEKVKRYLRLHPYRWIDQSLTCVQYKRRV